MLCCVVSLPLYPVCLNFQREMRCCYRNMPSRVSQSEVSSGARRGSSVGTPSRLSPNDAKEDESGCRKYKRPEAYCTGSASTRSGRLLICFFIHSKEEKKIVLITHERAMDTPRPDMSSAVNVFGDYTSIRREAYLDTYWL